MIVKNLRPVWAEINLDNISDNVKEVRRISKSKYLIAVLKANAYGFGAVDVSKTVLENGADIIAVAVLDEAIELRKANVKCPIMLFGYTPPESFEDLINYDVEQPVYSLDFAKKLSKTAKSMKKTAKIHIAVDTGMGRIGFLPEDKSIEEIYKISKLPNIKILGLFSHFSCADQVDKTYARLQMDRYKWFYEKIKEKNIDIGIRHIANSAAIMDMPESHFEAVRAGMILYGFYPYKEVDKKDVILKPAMNLKARVVNVKTMPKGSPIGYGGKFITQRESVIATLPLGYVDGYTRRLFGKSKVIIRGKYAPVVGNICMDQCMVDVTDVPGVKIGDEVTVIGEEGKLKFTAEDIADITGTESIEITCSIGRRVPRVYIKNNKIVKIRKYI